MTSKIGEGQVTPGNVVLTGQKGFSYRFFRGLEDDKSWLL